MQAEPATPGLSGAENRSEAPAGASRAIYWFARLTALATLCLLIAGALVVGHDAGLAVPDWPLSFGTWMPPMDGGVFYEHGHRMIAAVVGLLTTVLAVWLGWKDSRRWVKKLAAAAWVAVVVQAILGGLTVLYLLPVPILIAHACLAQLFFCLILSLVLFTSPAWERAADPPTAPLQGFEHLAAAATGALFLQLVLGAALRHKALGVGPHLIGAAVAGFLVGCVCYRAVAELGARDDVRKLARWVGGFLALQVILGVASYMLRGFEQESAQPVPSFILLTTAHVAVGALLLGSSLMLTLLAYRRLAVSGKVSSLAGSPQRTLA
jgi:cytochrome c oxidase assembly protein subunit 15